MDDGFVCRRSDPKNAVEVGLTDGNVVQYGYTDIKDGVKYSLCDDASHIVADLVWILLLK